MLHADLDTLAQVRVVLAEALVRGADPAEALDRAGLLDHAAKVRADRGKVIGEMADLLDEITVAQLVTLLKARMPTTMLDAKRLAVGWLRWQAKALS